MTIPWNIPLKRRGGKSRLGGIEVYFDFEWASVIGHPQGAFTNGKRLGELVKSGCPKDKKPILLLTAQDVDDQTIDVDDLYVVVIPIHRYLAESSPDAAATYFARRITAASGGLPRVSELVRNTTDLDSILHDHLDEHALKRWAGDRTDRIAALQRLSSAYSKLDDGSVTSSEEVIDALEKLESLSPELLETLVRLAEKSGGTLLKSLAEGLTSSEIGRQVTAETLADRVEDRLADARKTATEYRALLNNQDAGETELQLFVEKYPWILGLEYVKIVGRGQVVRGAVDFLVQRHDGFHDFLELKSPNSELVQALKRPKEEMPNSPSGYSLGPDLAQALAQVQYYKDMFIHQENAMETYGIRRTRYPCNNCSGPRSGLG